MEFDLSKRLAEAGTFLKKTASEAQVLAEKIGDEALKAGGVLTKEALAAAEQAAGKAKQTFADAKGAVDAELAKYMSASFVEAIVAGAAMVSYADGAASDAEKAKMVAAIQSSDATKKYELASIIRLWEKHAAQLNFSKDIGNQHALNAIRPFKGKPEAHLLVAIFKVIGEADHALDAPQKAVLVSICTALDLKPADFGIA
jgi:tellurite resistance protein TerB